MKNTLYFIVVSSVDEATGLSLPLVAVLATHCVIVALLLSQALLVVLKFGKSLI